MQQKLLLGLVLTLIIVIFIPFYWATESGRQEMARERIKTEAVRRGAELYTSHCAVCHGPTGEGRIGPALKGSPLDVKVLEKTIARGVPGKAMPAMASEEDGSLKGHQIKDLVTFIKNWDQSLTSAPSAPTAVLAPTPASTATPTAASAPTPATTPTPTAASASTPATTVTPTAALTPTQASTATPIPSSVNAGALFAGKCAACHGAKREGISGLGPALTPESLGPLSAAKVREAITAGRLAKGMPPFKDILSPEEIDALVQFLKNISP